TGIPREHGSSTSCRDADMTLAQWQRVKSVFQQTFDVDISERDARVKSLCGDDHQLRGAVERLLAGHGDAGAFLDTPPAMDGEASDAEASTLVAESTRSRIGPYRIVRELGRGGMGIVYLAERDDPGFHKTVAIKVVHRDSGLMLRRFRVETQILAALE